MKYLFYTLQIVLLILLTSAKGLSQASYCQNLSFEMGNFTNWEAYNWRYSTDHPEINTLPTKGLVNRRHTIISDVNAYDPNTGNRLKLVPPGYKYSARLGDGRAPEDRSPRCWHQSLRYTMTVDSWNTLLILKFALVLQWDSDHESFEEPKFSLTLFDQDGDTIPDCANYDVFATNSRIKGFHLFLPPDTQDSVQWRDWTTVGVNLTSYIGQTITIEFMASDCILGFDFGYAYFVASCQPMNITTKYCTNDSVAMLIAPEGFENYTWTNSTGSLVDTLQILTITNPAENSAYTCKLLSETGCEATLNTKINRYSPKADFSASMIDCNSNIVQLTNESVTNRGALWYNWDYGEGDPSDSISPRHKFLTSGLHTVTLTAYNPPSACSHQVTKVVESFSPPLVGISGESTYCPGDSTVLKAYGAFDYTWNDGSKADSIVVSAPGGEYMLIGRSSTGCTDTNYLFVTEEPDWEFSSEGDTAICVNDSAELIASGAVEYLWNTNDTINSIIISKPGDYFCFGKNLRGCQKTLNFHVEEIPPPGVEFVLSDSTLNQRNNNLLLTISPQEDVRYEWDLGDGSFAAGSSVQHAYEISNGKLAYTITLFAEDIFGCINQMSDVIDVIPFVPNVFSPNNDGINDLFMPELDLQVFDRNGILLYKGLEGWEGKYNGQLVAPDTYFYSIFYTDRYGVEHNKKGYVTVVR